MKSIMIVAFCLAVIFGYLNLSNENDEYNDTVVSNRASMFMNYASTFDSFYLANPSANGEVTSKVSLPSWVPVDNTIKMHIESGLGYVYMPSQQGILSKVTSQTDGSALVGITDSSFINTNRAKLKKPTFIPAGYLVYVR